MRFSLPFDHKSLLRRRDDAVPSRYVEISSISSSGLPLMTHCCKLTINTSRVLGSESSNPIVFSSPTFSRVMTGFVSYMFFP